MVLPNERWHCVLRFPQQGRPLPGPAAARVYHKTRMPKVMVLGVCARPCPEYAFDGKVGLRNFTTERPAKCSNVRTGTVAGETMILEDVSVDAATYRQKLIGKDGVFQAMREKMWWFHESARYSTVDGMRQPCGKHVGDRWVFDKRRGTKCSEAGKDLFDQHDGARPHTAQVNRRVFAVHGEKSGFCINVVVQPALSPDVNVDDLAFFASLQSNVSLVAKEFRCYFLAAVSKCWEEYPEDRTSNVWHCLYGSFHSILQSGGDNHYQRHRGSRQAQAASSEMGDLHDRTVSRQVIANAEKRLKQLQAEEENVEILSSDDAAETSSSEDD